MVPGTASGRTQRPAGLGLGRAGVSLRSVHDMLGRLS